MYGIEMMGIFIVILLTTGMVELHRQDKLYRQAIIYGLFGYGVAVLMILLNVGVFE